MAELPSLAPFGSRPFLVGRDREQAALRGALDRALAGHGGLVLIGGEAGIGKTALAEWLLTEAATAGALVLIGRCYDLSETPPYGPWVELFARAPRGDALPNPPDLASGAGATSQAALVQQVRDYVAALAAHRPLALLLDDLHWADPASLNLLRIVARDLADLPLLLLVTYRSDELPRHHPLAHHLPLLVHEARAARLDLPPLDAVALEALVRRYAIPPADTARLVAYLRERAEGNPFFAGELLRTLAEQGTLRHDEAGWHLGDLSGVRVSRLLRQVIEGRLERLGAADQQLLALAAVIGPAVPLTLWMAVGEVAEEALLAAVERAAEARLMEETEDGTRARFVHALIREVLYEGVLPSRRRVWHRQIGEAIAVWPRADPGAVAYHYQRASDPRAAEWLSKAGEQANRAYAYLNAAERFAAALALLEARGAAPEERGWLLFRLALVRRFADPPGSLARAEAIVGLAATAGDRALAATARIFRAHLRCWRDLGRGLAELATVVADLDALPAADRAAFERAALPGAPALDAASAWAMLLVWASRAGRFDEVRALDARIAAHLAAAGTDPSAHGPPGGWDQGLALLHAMLGQPEEARPRLERKGAASRAAGDFANLTTETGELLAWVVLPYSTDDLAQRRRLAEEIAASAARASGVLTVERSPGRVYLAALWQIEGRWAAARRLAEETLAWEATTATTLFRDAYPVVLGELARAQGDTALAWALVRELLPQGPETTPGDTYFRAALGLQRLAADLALDVGDLTTARAWLAAHDRWLAWNGVVLGQAEGRLGWAAYHRAASDPDAARRHAEAALAHATEPRQPLALLAAHRLLGELDAQAGRHTEALAHLDAALTLAEACAAPYERALTLLAQAEARVATRERDAAQALLHAARSLLEPLTAVPALARADILAARLAVAARTTLPFGLTAREAEVLALVAEGLSDAEIAERLFVSRHTVNGHTKAIYGKLGVTSRAAATRLALDHGLR